MSKGNAPINYFRGGSRLRNQYRTSTFIFFIASAGVMLCRLLAYYGAFGTVNDFKDLGFTLSLQLGFFIILPFLLYKLLLKKSAREVLYDSHVRRPKPLDVLTGAGLGAFGIFVSMGVSTAALIVLILLGYTPNTATAPQIPWLPYLTIGIMPALGEEFIYRGAFAFNLKKAYGFVSAVLLAGIFFGLGHMNIAQTVYTIPVGVAAAFLTYKSRSIFPAVTLHATNNLIGTAIDTVYYQTGFSLRTWFSSNIPVAMMGWAGCVAVCGVIIYFFNKRKKREAEAERLAEAAALKKAVEEAERAEINGYNPAPAPKSGESKSSQSAAFTEYERLLEREGEGFKPKLFDSMFLIAGIFLALAATVISFISGYMI